MHKLYDVFYVPDWHKDGTPVYERMVHVTGRLSLEAAMLVVDGAEADYVLTSITHTYRAPTKPQRVLQEV
jgi:hypothetical protein